MDERYALMRQGSDVWRSLRDGDFEEEDVWDVLRDRKDSASSNLGKIINPSISVPRNFSSAARVISINSSSSSSSSSDDAKLVQQSAPVNIPDWSKISRKKSKKTSKNASSWLEHDAGIGYDDDYDAGFMDDGRDSDDVGYDDDEDDDDDDGGGEYNYKVPPHEVIARRLARSQISSFSVFEGAGRTLKGRDLSKVRNAVLTKTGFLESL